MHDSLYNSLYSLPYSVYQDLVDERDRLRAALQDIADPDQNGRDLRAIARDAIANTEGGAE